MNLFMIITHRYLILTIFFLVFFETSDAGIRLDPLGYKKPKATVCLNMIVKNEADVITRCLESVLPLIDYWVIVDTGSTDGTQQIIKDYMKEKNIPGEIHESPWISFSHNREEALRLAKFKADYLLFMDADDILSYDDNFKLPNLIHDCYLIVAKAGTTEYTLTRLIKTRLDWHWQGALHEYVHSTQAKEGAILKGIEYIYICDGARSKDPEKFLKDAAILLEALEKEPDNARYMFYLAQTYASGHDLDKALEYYQKRTEMGGWDQEVFWAKFQIAHILRALGRDRTVVEAAFVDALKYRPSRPEPYYYLASIARENNEFEKGYEIGRQGIKLKMTNDTLFAEKWTYEGLLIEFSACAASIGKYDECLNATDQLLKKKNLNPQLRMCAEQNREYATEKLRTKEIINAVDALFEEG